MTKFNPSELADKYREEHKAQRNREYQREYYKLNKKKILQRQKEKRDSKKVVLSDEANKRRDAAIGAKRREYNRNYYLRHRKLKEKPSEEEQVNMDAKRMTDRREYKHNWYLKNRERILQKQKEKRAEARRNKSTQKGSNEEVCILQDQLEATENLLHCNLQLKDQDKSMIKMLKTKIKDFKKQIAELTWSTFKQWSKHHAILLGKKERRIPRSTDTIEQAIRRTSLNSLSSIPIGTQPYYQSLPTVFVCFCLNSITLHSDNFRVAVVWV